MKFFLSQSIILFFFSKLYSVSTQILNGAAICLYLFISLIEALFNFTSCASFIPKHIFLCCWKTFLLLKNYKQYLQKCVLLSSFVLLKINLSRFLIQVCVIYFHHQLVVNPYCLQIFVLIYEQNKLNYFRNKKKLMLILFFSLILL